MRGYFVFAIVGLLMTTSSVFAEDRPIADAISRAVSATTSTEATTTQAAENGTRIRHRGRPWPLPILYGSSAFLNAYDAYLTLAGLEAGASEANPLMKPITKSPAAFIAVKAALTTASIVGAEQLWKDHHRKGAVAVMILSNAIMVAIAAQNTSVVQRVK